MQVSSITKVVQGLVLTDGKIIWTIPCPQDGSISDVSVIVVPLVRATFELEILVSGFNYSVNVETDNNEVFNGSILTVDTVVVKFDPIVFQLGSIESGRQIKELQIYCEVN